MRIVIIGAGKLGFAIADLLSSENYEVVVVDKDEEQLAGVRDYLDVLTIHGDGTSPALMRDPDVRDSDFLVAVTDMDEVNILSCILAKKNGIAHTISRIRDQKFLSESKDYLKDNFDIDYLLSPELITAREINRILMTPQALNVEDFANGRVRLFEMKVTSRSPFCHKRLKDIKLPDSVLIAMILRDHQMIIPHGNDKILPLDNIYLIGNPKQIQTISETMTPQSTRKVQRAFIIGAGRTGQALAPMLDREGISLKVLDNNRERCQEASEKVKNGIVIMGDGTDIDLLRQEGAGDADVVICTTRDEKLNLMMALLSHHLGAKRTIVRVVRSEYVPLMESVGIDIALSTRLLAAGEVLSFVRSEDVVSVSLLEEARVQAVELIVQEGSPVDGRPLMDVNIPKECLVGAYVRNDETFIPNGRSVLRAGDRVILIIQATHADKVLSYFKSKK